MESPSPRKQFEDTFKDSTSNLMDLDFDFFKVGAEAKRVEAAAL
jgi:hypothetical protein